MSVIDEGHIVDEIEVELTLDQVRSHCNRIRPDETTDQDWLQPVIDRVASNMATPRARDMAARKFISIAESTLLQATNRYLRKWVTTGEWPIDFMDLSDYPLALDDKGHKLRLGAASAEHWVLALQFQEDQFTRQEQAHQDLRKAHMQIIEMLSSHRVPNLDAYMKKSTDPS